MPGADAVLDEAVKLHPRLQAYLAQDWRVAAGLDEARQGLEQIFT